jgi:tripartite-type tricarboxylate transporter receptor subunit TctC
LVFPTGPVELIAPASPGGGWDATARVLQKVLTEEKIISQPVNVVNRPGAGGQVGWSYLNEHKGNAHYLAMNSPLLFPPELTGQATMSYKDFTPLARLTTEYMVVAVPAASPFHTGKEFLNALRQDPTKYSIGIGTGVGGDDHVSILKAARSAGVEIKRVRTVVFASGGDQMTAILGGNVDVVSTTVSEAKEQAEAGKLRLIAVSSPQRLQELPNVPTWAEMGVDGTFYHWRGIQGPKDMTPDQIAAWDAIIGRVVKSEAWQKELATRGWTDAYMPSKEFTAFLGTSRTEFAEILREVGLVK